MEATQPFETFSKPLMPIALVGTPFLGPITPAINFYRSPVLGRCWLIFNFWNFVLGSTLAADFV